MVGQCVPGLRKKVWWQMVWWQMTDTDVPCSRHFACALYFPQEKLRTCKMGMRIVLTFVLEGKERFPIVVPAFPRPWLAAVALKM